jgi:hypothetical protein
VVETRVLKGFPSHWDPYIWEVFHG